MARPRIDLLIRGAREVITCAASGGDPAGRRRGIDIAIAGETIAAIGPPGELARDWDLSGARIFDASGCIIAPGFVDCHTHLVFGGSRAAEYGARMTKSAAEVRASGIPTGIRATVEMTRAAKREELLAYARPILQRMFRAGTTTVEIKSGYGLSTAKEFELLEVIRLLAGESQKALEARKGDATVGAKAGAASAAPLDIVPTFLGAHDVPPETSKDRYVGSVIDDMIPKLSGSGLAEFCDVYCDEWYFSADDTRRILEAGLRAGMRPKIHVDAYANIGGCRVATDLGAVSADHLNFTSREEMAALAKAGIVGVLMPGLDFAVRHPHPFDARAMLDEGMTIALATDFCPAAWVESMQVVMQLACRLYGLSPEEALVAATSGAAKAVGRHDRGRIEPGMLADLQAWEIPSFEDLIYRIGNNSVAAVIRRGRSYDFREDSP